MLQDGDSSRHLSNVYENWYMIWLKVGNLFNQVIFLYTLSFGTPDIINS